ncbi:hypothetical protein EAO77_03145 [Streptomyces sp. t39]|nr:hypothetical protein EAO77_03145 [Streptomyces sp. t39]
MGDAVRWAAFACLLAPVALVAYGMSAGGTAAAWAGLAAVACACRLLLHHSRGGAGAGRSRDGAGAGRIPD